MFVNDDICTLPPPPTPQEQEQKQQQSSQPSSSAPGKIYTLKLRQLGEEERREILIQENELNTMRQHPPSVRSKDLGGGRGKPAY